MLTRTNIGLTIEQDELKGFSRTIAEIEWLLQILNDVRVGSWLSLGSPDEELELSLLNAKTAPHFWTMQLAGEFEMRLLKALEA